MFQTFLLLAEDPPKATPQDPGGIGSMLPFLAMLFVLFYFMIIRPMRRQEKERQSLLTSMKKNDKVILTSGIYGTIVSVAEKEDEIVVKVDDNTRLKMLKSSILRNLTNEEAAKALKETKPAGA